MTNTNIPRFNIFSNYTQKPINVSGGIASLYYYESIFDNTIRVTATFADTGNRVGSSDNVSVLEQLGANLNAGERVELVMTDDKNQVISFRDNYELRIKEIRNIVEDTVKAIFTIDFYSKEIIDNELIKCRVEQRYDGKISDNVQRILKNDCLKTKKNIEIDPTINHFSFIGNSEKPFYKLLWLAKRSIPEMTNAKGNTAGYFFYEIGDDGRGNGGFKFKSIDKLFQNSPKRILIFNNTTGLPIGYDAKILEYSFDSTIDLQKKLVSGSMFPSELRTFDLYENSYEGEKTDEFDPSRQIIRRNIGGLDAINLGDISRDSTRKYDKIESIGIIPVGRTPKQQIENSKKIDIDIKDIIRQSATRYNNLFNVKLSICIEGDFGVHIGDLIHCDFPEVSGKKNKQISQKISGIYMIVDLCHYISPSGPTYTRLNLVRDTIGRKPF
jgi:hypothetical protein